jgi:hypothetical protein
MTNLSSVKFCDRIDYAETISITLENGNEWAVQLAADGKFKREAGCFTYLNGEHFISYKNNANELAEEEQAISAAEDFHAKWSIKTKITLSTYEVASQALTDSGKAMNTLLDLYKDGQLPFTAFLEFMDAMKSTVQAKTIQGIKHD